MLSRLIAIASIVLMVNNAFADSDERGKAAGPQRSGVVLGVTLGLGALHGAPAMAAGWRVGHMITPRVAGLLEVSGSFVPTGAGAADTEPDPDAPTRVRNQQFVGPAAQAWFRSRLWGRAGLGLSSVLGTRGDEDLPEYGPGALLAVGFHLAGGDGLTLDLQASTSVSSHGLNPVLDGLGSIGVTWY